MPRVEVDDALTLCEQLSSERRRGLASSVASGRARGRSLSAYPLPCTRGPRASFISVGRQRGASEYQRVGCIWPLADYQAKLACLEILGRYRRPDDLKGAIQYEIEHPHFNFEGGQRIGCRGAVVPPPRPSLIPEECIGSGLAQFRIVMRHFSMWRRARPSGSRPMRGSEMGRRSVQISLFSHRSRAIDSAGFFRRKIKVENLPPIRRHMGPVLNRQSTSRLAGRKDVREATGLPRDPKHEHIKSDRTGR